ncbi:hydrogenase [Chromobacterium amazonense]|uniref:hydrogenase 4 subunit F n=1 Tax=Chromobacterium amazonense TaxID=1382803 RepID=UPI0008DAE2EE|nr:hydrogenase 4 subunit F [Chromobacterium amazonense]OHX11932.1 hydrogenase [Chromobacterium amazonense]
MTATHWLVFLLSIPLAASALCAGSRLAGEACAWLASTLHLASVSLLLALSLAACAEVVSGGPLEALDGWLRVDALGALFLALIGVLGFATGLYAVGYMRHELQHGEVGPERLAGFYAIFQLFLFTMLLTVTANNVIMMWVAVEATTLGSAFLVGFYGQRSSLEAAWKYMVICTVGVAFGLYGVLLVYSNAASLLGDHGGAAQWTTLLTVAHQLDPALTRIAFVFVLIGFGTKAGFFPMHAWLPDAHSEAPSPVSALLSAVLLNCALLIVIRFHMLASGALGPDFSETLLLVFGLMSVAVAALFILSQRHIKRLLAYSSVENMGLIAIGLGLGGPLGVMAALFHTVNHSLAKALLFCGSGNVLLKYGTPDMGSVKGLLRAAPLTAMLFGAGALALGGIPPFNVFYSEFLIVAAGFKQGHVALTIVVLLLLTIVLAGLARMLAATLFGPAPDEVEPGEAGWLTLLPLILLMLAMLAIGLFMPDSLQTLLREASQLVLAAANHPVVIR